MDLQNPLDVKVFSHERLKLGGNSIRLITLQPDDNDYNPIICEINQHALHRRPGYAALSYMWGSADEQHAISLNGKPFYVRRNLYDCLVQFRNQHHEPITLWIDALCIDQTNISERNHVVQLMDQVYERSDQVYVWLGPGDDSSDRAMLFLKEIATCMESRTDAVDFFFETYMLPAVYYHDWVAVVRLFKRDYWTRLWVIQETLLAPSLEVFCGTHRVLWKHIEEVILLVNHSLGYYDKRRPGKSALHVAIGFTLAARMVLRRRDSARFSGGRESYPKLQTLLENFKDAQCFDARDEVFGLLSIAGDFYNKRIDYIDYNLRSTQIFIRFLQHYLKSFNDPEDDETLYNIRRLSDALRLDVFPDILQSRHSSPEAAILYSDLTIKDDDLLLTMPCRVLLEFIDMSEHSGSSRTGCILRDQFSSCRDGDHSPLNIVDRPFSSSLPGSDEETYQLRHLVRSKGHQVCDAWSDCSDTGIIQPGNHNSSTFKYFTRPVDKSSIHLPPCFGITSPNTQPSDLLVKSKESDLIFVARHSHEGVYDVVGTALIHSDSSTIARVKTSVRKLWHPHGSHATTSSPSSNNPNSIPDRDLEIPNVRFNPLMLLMIVNEPNWRKDHINSDPSKTLQFQRQPTSYTAIQPRGDDDPVLKSFGTKIYTGSPHVDRAANKFRDRTVLKLEEIKELTRHYDESW